MADQIIQDVVDYAVDEAKRVVEENTGVDLRRRGHEDRNVAPDRVSSEMERDVWQLGEEHDREIRKLYDERNQKFDAKVREENRRFDEKRQEILR